MMESSVFVFFPNENMDQERARGDVLEAEEDLLEEDDPAREKTRARKDCRLSFNWSCKAFTSSSLPAKGTGEKVREKRSSDRFLMNVLQRGMSRS